MGKSSLEDLIFGISIAPPQRFICSGAFSRILSVRGNSGNPQSAYLYVFQQHPIHFSSKIGTARATPAEGGNRSNGPNHLQYQPLKA